MELYWNGPADWNIGLELKRIRGALLILKEWTTFHERLPPSELRSTGRMLDIHNPLDGPVSDSLQDAKHWCMYMRAGDQQDGVLNQHSTCLS